MKFLTILSFLMSVMRGDWYCRRDDDILTAALIGICITQKEHTLHLFQLEKRKLLLRTAYIKNRLKKQHVHKCDFVINGLWIRHEYVCNILSFFLACLKSLHTNMQYYTTTFCNNVCKQIKMSFRTLAHLFDTQLTMFAMFINSS